MAVTFIASRFLNLNKYWGVLLHKDLKIIMFLNHWAIEHFTSKPVNCLHWVTTPMLQNVFGYIAKSGTSSRPSSLGFDTAVLAGCILGVYQSCSAQPARMV